MPPLTMPWPFSRSFRSTVAPARPDPLYVRNVDLLGPAPPYSPCDHWAHCAPTRSDPPASAATDMTVLNASGVLVESQAADCETGAVKIEEGGPGRVGDGAPVAGPSGARSIAATEESDSPLGYDVGMFSAFMLNTSQMIGGPWHPHSRVLGR